MCRPQSAPPARLTRRNTWACAIQVGDIKSRRDGSHHPRTHRTLRLASAPGGLFARVAGRSRPLARKLWANAACGAAEVHVHEQSYAEAGSGGSTSHDASTRPGRKWASESMRPKDVGQPRTCAITHARAVPDSWMGPCLITLRSGGGMPANAIAPLLGRGSALLHDRPPPGSAAWKIRVSRWECMELVGRPALHAADV